MRIERIRTKEDLKEFVLDQVGHAALFLLVAIPVAWLSGKAWLGAVTGTLVLIAREVHQYFGKDRSWEGELPFYVAHLDRTLDVVIGAALGSPILEILF